MSAGFLRFSGLPRPNITPRKLRISKPFRPSSTQTSTSTGNIFERVPREELVTKFKSRLRDRRFTPGSTGGGFPEYLGEPRESLPHGVRVHNPNKLSLAELTAECMAYSEQHLAEYGALLFRNLPATTAEDFSTIVKASKGKGMSYDGGVTFRVQVDKDSKTYTASNEPADVTIEVHNEMSYNDVYPSKLFFYCLRRPADGCGGETPLVKNSELLSKLDPQVVKKFEEMQVRYVRYLPDKSRGEYMNWQHVFTTEDRKDAEVRSVEQGYNFTWDPSGDLYLWVIRPAVIAHPVTGDKVWFNQAAVNHCSYYKSVPTFAGKDIPDDKFPCHTYYGDGSAIEAETLQHLRATAWSCAVGFKWQEGDLLVLDNCAVQHGRIGFKGERMILAFLLA